jgi:hypothetical protein
MPEPEAAEGDEAGPTESDWVHVDHDHYLSTPPVDDDLAPPLVATAPLSLNTNELPWETFERLSLTVARALDGALDVRMYGLRGQAQEGIDLVAFFDNKPTTVYQVKRYRVFSAAQPSTAVKKYADGDRPFSATRLVVVVACDAHDTAIVQELAALRKAYPDLTIDLWDKTRISEMLVDQSRIVRRFFGAATCEQFCGEPSPTGDAEPSPIDPDAVMRGPIRHMGLGDDLKRASELLADSPAAAAAKLGEIAAILEASPFAGHAVKLRRQEATALEQAGELAQSFRVRLDVAWRLVDSQDLWMAHVVLNEMAKSDVELADDLVRSANILSEVVALRREHSGSLDRVAERFDELEAADPHRHTAAVAFTEECIASRREELVSQRTAVLLEVAGQQTDDPAGQLVAARIQTCIADATGTWQSLANSARETYEPAIAALVLARHARFSAIALNPELALIRYQDAIERSTAERRYGDAANWLYAVRAVRVRFHLMEGDPNENHYLAEALTTLGVESVFPARSTREHALSRLLAENWPDALEALRRYRWHSVVTASWTEETESNELIGDVFLATGRPLEAAEHYVRAGNRDKAKTAGASFPEVSVGLRAHQLTDPPWERSAAYRLVASLADLLTEESARSWAAVALDDAIANNEARLGDNLGVDALAAFASLSDSASELVGDRFIEFAAALVPRDHGHYRFTDESHVRALLGVAAGQPALRPAALRQALELLLLDDRLGQIVLNEGGRLLQLEVPLVEEMLAGPAAKGHTMACLGLVVSGADTAPAVSHANERLAAATAKRVHVGGVQRFGTGYGRDVALVRVLGEAEQERFVDGMIEAALDAAEPAPNRGSALGAASQLVGELSPGAKARIFVRAIEFARGDHDLTSTADLFDGPPDLLSRFRFDLGSRSLRSAGLRLAARCARSDEDQALVRELALDLLHEGDDLTANHVAHALSSLPPGTIVEVAEVLGAHSSEWIRSLAAMAWAADSDPSPSVGRRLANDPSPRVRRAMASALRDRPEHQATREILERDPRRSVRTLALAASDAEDAT